MANNPECIKAFAGELINSLIHILLISGGDNHLDSFLSQPEDNPFAYPSGGCSNNSDFTLHRHLICDRYVINMILILD